MVTQITQQNDFVVVRFFFLEYLIISHFSKEKNNTLCDFKINFSLLCNIYLPNYILHSLIFFESLKYCQGTL